MKQLNFLKLTFLAAIFSMIYVYSPAQGAAVTSAAFERWMERPGNEEYGSMGLLALKGFEADVERLGETYKAFYRDLATDLIENPEFMASAYLNEDKPPLTKEFLVNILGHGIDVATAGISLYVFRQQGTMAADCEPCFATHNITSATVDCTQCYSDIFGANLNALGLVSSGIALAKSAGLLVYDLRELCSGMGRARFTPTDPEKEREAHKIAIYLTLKKQDAIRDAKDSESLRRDYRGWVLTTLRTHYVRGSKISPAYLLTQSITGLH